MIVFADTRSEDERDAPDTRKCYKSVDDTGNDRTLTAADPGYKVKFEQTYGSPVESADHYKYKRDSIKHN